MTYKIGDVVRLKSGGVPMCVTAYHPYGSTPTPQDGTWIGTVSVTWLTTDGVPKSYVFDERLIVPAILIEEPTHFKSADGSLWERIGAHWEKTADVR